MQKMLQDLKEGAIKGIVSKEIARTSRDVTDIIDIKRRIVNRGGFFIAIKENYDSRTDDDEFLLILYGALAQKEAKTTASRVKITQMIKAREGKTNVPLPAYGYMLSKDGQYLVKNPETYQVYRFIIERYLDGWGQLKIAKHLNREGIPTRRGQKWSAGAVKVVLSNPVYLGITMYNVTTLVRDENGKPKRVKRPRNEWVVRHNTHEPLISKTEYNKVQSIMQKRRCSFAHEWSCQRKYLGSSLLRCASCKGKIYGSRFLSKIKGRGYYYRYICRGASGRCSSTKYWKMEEVDYNIRELFKNLFCDKERLFDYVKNEADIVDDDLQDIQSAREKLNSENILIERAITKQQQAYEADVITLDEYKARMCELRNKKMNLQAEVRQLNHILMKHDSVTDRLNKMFEIVEGKIIRIHELPKEEVAEYIDAVFKSLYLDKDGNIVDVEFIDW